MGSYIQILLDALRAHVRNNGRNEARSFAEDDVGSFTGLFLEDMRVDTSFTLNTMNRDINPLIELLYGEDKSQFRINRLQDHLARIEMKVQQLESRVPHTTEQNILVAAAEVDDDEDEESDDTSKKKSSEKSGTTASGSEDSRSKGSSQKGGSKKSSEKKGSKKGKETKCGDENENKNCLTRLLFSKCWSGKNNNSGWNAICCNKPGRVRKGACPAYSTCPCGDDAPCAKIERKPCPANDKKGGKGKSGGGGGDKEKEGGKGKDKGSGKGKSGKGGSKSNKEKCDKKKKDENPLSALCEKICNVPCFSKKGGERGESGEGNKSSWRCGSCNRKKHVHTPCCCRCKDNPELEEKKKSKGGQKQSDKKDNGKKQPAKKEEPKKEKPKKSSESSEDYEDADETSVHSALIVTRREDRDPTQEPIRCLGCTDCDDIRRASKEVPREKIQGVKGQRKNVTEEIVKSEVNGRPRGDTIFVPKKSSTNLQVLLPPSISSESTNHNMVSHQILKTLSTIHGPIRVEQKIVLKGTKNAFVIVTHGEACECNVCSTLKNDGITEKTGDGNPKVVRFPTDTGCDTLVNHCDDCQCNLCSVLQHSITDDGPTMNMDFDGGTVWASWSKNNVTVPSNQSSEFGLQDSYKKEETKAFELIGNDGQNGGHSKKHCHKNKDGKHKRKKCNCMKCLKRRKIKKLKKRLKHVSDISQVLRELSHHGFTVEQDVDEYRRDWEADEEENMRKASRTSSKRVSFSSGSKTLVRTVSKESMFHSEPLSQSGKRKLLSTFTKGDKEQKKEKSKDVFSYKSFQKSDIKESRHHSHNSNVDDKLCDCVVCNTKYPNNISQVNVKPTIVHHRSSKVEEQKCFPEKSKSPKCGCKKNKSDKAEEELLNKVIHPGDDFIRPPTRCEPGCTGRCSVLTPYDELSHMGTDQVTPVVLQASKDKEPPKVLYWIPTSPSLSAAYSSDSYYIPDLDEFPTSDRDGKQGVGANSTIQSSQRNQSQTSSRLQPGSSTRSRTTRSLNEQRLH